MVEWHKVPGFPAYEVSNAGEVRRTQASRRGGFPKGYVLNSVIVNGYKRVDLCASGKRQQLSVHRLVCEAFHGPSPSPKHHAAHNDGNKLNNDAQNLRWATPKENQGDRVTHGTNKCGEQVRQAKLTAEQVIEIRQRLKAGHIQTCIAKDFGVTKGTVSMIKRGETWKHV